MYIMQLIHSDAFAMHQYRPISGYKASSEQKYGASINNSINQSKHISIAPYVASESEAHDDGN